MKIMTSFAAALEGVAPSIRNQMAFHLTAKPLTELRALDTATAP